MRGYFILTLTLGVVGATSIFARAEDGLESTKPAWENARLTPGFVRDDNSLGMKLVWIPPGRFTMRSEGLLADDPPRVQNVEIPRGIWVGQTEVTQAQWTDLMDSTPWRSQRFVKECSDCAATYISWIDAIEFCNTLTEFEHLNGQLPTHLKYTLPTTQQWEYACRAETQTKFSFGDDESKLDEYAWFRKNCADAGEKYAHEVGKKKPNPWGLYDLHGNVAEWCLDKYPLSPNGRTSNVNRFGSWLASANACRSDHSNAADQRARTCFLGFRVIVEPVPASK